MATVLEPVVAPRVKRYHHYTALRWFRTTVGLGFLLNLTFVFPALFAPRFLESLSAFGATNTVHWLQNVGLLLAIVTAMYIPVLADPFRYFFVTVLVVAGRFAAGMLFLTGVLFMNFPGGMRYLAVTDLVLSSIQAVLLYRMLRDGDPRSSYPVYGNV
jgi:hypothetical protein